MLRRKFCWMKSLELFGRIAWSLDDGNDGEGALYWLAKLWDSSQIAEHRESLVSGGSYGVSNPHPLMIHTFWAAECFFLLATYVVEIMFDFFMLRNSGPTDLGLFGIRVSLGAFKWYTTWYWADLQWLKMQISQKQSIRSATDSTSLDFHQSSHFWETGLQLSFHI